MGCFNCCPTDKRTREGKYVLTELSNPALFQHYYGEKQSTRDSYFGLTWLTNNTENFNYLGYHCDRKCTGFAETSSKSRHVEGWCLYEDQEPQGCGRLIFDLCSEYIGQLRTNPHGKGKYKASKLANVSQYKGYFMHGKRANIGEAMAPYWYYIGQFTDDLRGPFGKYRHIVERSVYQYVGYFSHGVPEGQGIMTCRYYEDEPVLQNPDRAQKPQWTSKVVCVGKFREGKQVSGTEQSKTPSGTNEPIDIQTKEEVIPAELEGIKEIIKTTKEGYAKLYKDIYTYDFDDLKLRDIYTELLVDRISTLHLKLTKRDGKVLFAKGRLCGTANELAYALHETYILRMLETSRTALESTINTKKPAVYPHLANSDVYPECPQYPIYNMSFSPPNVRKTLVKEVATLQRFDSAYYMTYMTYYPDKLWLNKLIKAKNLTPNNIGYLFFKTVESLQVLEGFGVLKGQIKLSSIVVDPSLVNWAVVLTGYGNSRFFREKQPELCTRWTLLDLYRPLLQSLKPQSIPFNPFENKRDQGKAYISFLCAGEYKNKKTLYLPPDVKKHMHSENWKDRVIDVNYGQLTLYSLAMAFLKAFAIVFAFEELKNRDYKAGAFYSRLQELKLLSYIENPETSLEECQRIFDDTFKKLIEDMIKKVNQSSEAAQALSIILNIRTYTSSYGLPSLDTKAARDSVNELKRSVQTPRHFTESHGKPQASSNLHFSIIPQFIKGPKNRGRQLAAPSNVQDPPPVKLEEVKANIVLNSIEEQKNEDDKDSQLVNKKNREALPMNPPPSEHKEEPPAANNVEAPQNLNSHAIQDNIVEERGPSLSRGEHAKESEIEGHKDLPFPRVVPDQSKPPPPPTRAYPAPVHSNGQPRRPPGKKAEKRKMQQTDSRIISGNSDPSKP